MKRTRQELADSDNDDMDNLPLKYISSNKIIAIDELRKPSVHLCEFCDKTFENRYDHLIHNARHIIIPLIKMLPYYCAECDLHCISQEEMNDHMTIKHTTVTVNVTNVHNPNINDCKVKLEKCMFKIENNEEEYEDEKPLSRLNKTLKTEKTAQNNGTVNVLKNFVLNCNVDMEKIVLPAIHQFDIQGITLDKYKNNMSHCLEELKPSVELKNETKNSRVNNSDQVEEFKPSVENNINNIVKGNFENSDLESEFSDLDEDPIVILAPVKSRTVTEEDNGYCSIHFDDLIKPGIFNCKRCSRSFPNRYEVIVHEVTHMDLSKAELNSCEVVHREHTTSTRKTDLPCSRCHEMNSCNKNAHAKKCFRLNCYACGRVFYDRKTMENHVEKCNGESVVNMCDICLYCRKRPRYVQYFGIVRLNKQEKRACHWCGKLSEGMSSVTVCKQRMVDRIRFESDVCEQDGKVNLLVKTGVKEAIDKPCRGGIQRGRGRGLKTLSNRERLKMIQNRLKLMKK